MKNLDAFNFQDEFTAKETAALIGGIDPRQIYGQEILEFYKVEPIFQRMGRDYSQAWSYWHARSDGNFEFNESAELPDEAIQSVRMSGFKNEIAKHGISESFAEYIDHFIGHGTSQDGEFSAFQMQEFSRAEIVRWLSAVGMKSVYQFDRSKDLTEPTTIVQSDPDIDPSDLPIELDAANMAYRAVLNGYGDKSDTFKNRLIDYLQKNFTDLKNEAVQRIATVANPDKSAGRKSRDKE